MVTITNGNVVAMGGKDGKDGNFGSSYRYHDGAGYCYGKWLLCSGYF